MYTIKNNVNNEVIINKSKFITYIYKVNNKEEVISYLKKLKKEYKDSTHICYSYIINNEKRFSDDGEPGGTAGMPILNVLEQQKLNNILAVIIRYFGGIKLGAGGLVRAYSNSTSETLKKTAIVLDIKKIKIRIEFDYNSIDNINYILKDTNITYKEFNNTIIYEFLYEENNYPKLLDNYIIKKESIN